MKERLFQYLNTFFYAFGTIVAIALVVFVILLCVSNQEVKKEVVAPMKLDCSETSFSYLDEVKLIKGFYSGFKGELVEYRCGDKKEYLVRIDHGGGAAVWVTTDFLELAPKFQENIEMYQSIPVINTYGN